MSPRNRGKTVPASALEAKSRLDAARAFVAVAELVHAEPDDPVLPLRGVAAAVAVLGGIAAADAICAHGRRVRVAGGRQPVEQLDRVGEDRRQDERAEEPPRVALVHLLLRRPPRAPRGLRRDVGGGRREPRVDPERVAAGAVGVGAHAPARPSQSAARARAGPASGSAARATDAPNSGSSSASDLLVATPPSWAAASVSALRRFRAPRGRSAGRRAGPARRGRGRLRGSRSHG